MNDEYFDVPENNDGTPLFYNPHPIFTEDAEIDEVQLTAKNSFGIKRQRLRRSRFGVSSFAAESF